MWLLTIALTAWAAEAPTPDGSAAPEDTDVTQVAPVSTPPRRTRAREAEVHKLMVSAMAASVGLELNPWGHLRYAVGGDKRSDRREVDLHSVVGDQIVVALDDGRILVTVPRIVFTTTPLPDEKNTAYGLLPGGFDHHDKLGPTAWGLPVSFEDARPYLAEAPSSAFWVKRAKMGRELTIGGAVVTALSLISMPMALLMSSSDERLGPGLGVGMVGIAGLSMFTAGAVITKHARKQALRLYASPTADGFAAGAHGTF